MAPFNLTDLLGQSILSTIQLVYSPVEYFYQGNTIGDCAIYDVVISII